MEELLEGEEDAGRGSEVCPTGGKQRKNWAGGRHQDGWIAWIRIKGKIDGPITGTVHESTTPEERANSFGR